MNRNYIALALATALTAGALGGCATDPTTGLPVFNNSTLTDVENQVQQDAATICSFVPTAATVAAVVATYVGLTPLVTLADTAATAICNAVVPVQATAFAASGRLSKATPPQIVVNGKTIPINGYFIVKK